MHVNAYNGHFNAISKHKYDELSFHNQDSSHYLDFSSKFLGNFLPCLFVIVNNTTDLVAMKRWVTKRRHVVYGE
jgi:hypothetical protein